MNETRAIGALLPGRISKVLPRLAATILAVWFVVVWARTLNIEQALRDLRHVRGEWLGVAAVFYVLAWAARSERWRYLLLPTCRVSPVLALRLTAMSQALNLALPARSGDVAVAIGLQKLRRVPVEAVVSILLLDKIFEVLGIIVVVTAGVLLGLDVAEVVPDRLVVIGAASLIVCIANGLFVAMWLLRRLSAHPNMVRWLSPSARSWLQKTALQARSAIQMAIRQPRPVFLAVVCTFAALSSDIGSFWATFQAFGQILPLDRLLFGILLFRLISLIPSTPGRVGSYELSATLVFSVLLGANPTRIGAISATRHLGVSVLAVALGLIGALQVRRDSSRSSIDAPAGVPGGVV